MKKIRYLHVTPLFEYRDHYEMIPVAVEVLKNDGKMDVYNFLKSTNPATGDMYLSLVAKGALDADLPWSLGYIFHMYHFHHPWTHRGYLTNKSAADALAGLFPFAQNLWTQGRKGRAVYQLGRMMHLLQDIFIPHHAAVTAVIGHGQLESWLSNNWRHYLIEKGGYYSWERIFKSSTGQIHTVSSKNPYDWIEAGSHIPIDWYEEYFQNYNTASDIFPQLASKIVPYALRYSAGFINRFFIGLTL